MRYRRIGTHGPVVSEIGLGTWQNLWRHDKGSASRLVSTALDRGINFFDTAASYGDSQAILGEALRGVPRGDVVLSTKVFYGRSEASGLGAHAIRSATETALRDLETDYVDLMSAHRYDFQTPLAETVEAFGALIEDGLITHWGTSEWTAAEISSAVDLCDELGRPRPVANQPQYSILWRVPESEVIPLCEKVGIGQVAFWALGQGVLTGKYKRGELPPVGSRADHDGSRATMDYLLLDEILDRVELFGRLAEKRRVTPAQLALAWVLSRKGVASTVVGASSPDQIIANASADRVEVSQSTADLIDRLFMGCVQDDPRATG